MSLERLERRARDAKNKTRTCFLYTRAPLSAFTRPSDCSGWGFLSAQTDEEDRGQKNNKKNISGGEDQAAMVSDASLPKHYIFRVWGNGFICRHEPGRTVLCGGVKIASATAVRFLQITARVIQIKKVGYNDVSQLTDDKTKNASKQVNILNNVKNFTNQTRGRTNNGTSPARSLPGHVPERKLHSQPTVSQIKCYLSLGSRS